MKVMAVIGSAVMATGMLAGCGNSNTAATTRNREKAEESKRKQSTEAVQQKHRQDGCRFRWFYQHGRFHFYGEVGKCNK